MPEKTAFPMKVHILFFLFFVFCAWLSSRMIPDYPESGSDSDGLSKQVGTLSRDLPLPPAKPRKAGFNPFDRPFLFEAQGTSKMSFREREDILWNQYSNIVSELNGTEIPAVETDDVRGLVVVKVGGAPFVTVLPEDCPAYYPTLSNEGQDEVERAIAEQWAEVLRDELLEENEMRSEEYLAAYPYIVVFLFSLGAVCHTGADFFSRRMLNSPGWSLKSFIWLSFLALAFVLHPELKSLAIALSRGALMPVFVGLLIATIVNVIYQLAVWLLHRYIGAYLQQRGRSDRLVQRLKTIGQGVRFLIATLAAAGGFTWFLIAVGVPVDRFLTGAGVAGVLIGVIGRDVILDYFYGLSVLTEDKYGVDDWIESGTHFGQVVRFHLRATEIREVDGALTSLSNGDLRIVKNHSRLWGFADLRVTVSYECPADEALRMLAEEIERFRDSEPGQIDGEPTILAIQEISDHGMVLRALLKTAPAAQWNVKRQLNRLILNRLAKEGFPPPIPQRLVRWEKIGLDSKTASPTPLDCVEDKPPCG